VILSNSLKLKNTFGTLEEQSYYLDTNPPPRMQVGVCEPKIFVVVLTTIRHGTFRELYNIVKNN